MSKDKGINDQSQRLPRKTLFVTLGCLTASLFVSFFDQTAVTTSIPSIAKDLPNSYLVNSWVGTSYLIANTNFQLLYGRLSDIFGRKQIFLFSLGCLLVGNLISGFAKDPIVLFIFRGLSGLGGGGINCLVMITFSDLLTTRERGKYFGFVAISTSFGNGIGPFVGGVLSEKASWRWTFWISCPIAVLCGILVVFFVPLKKVSGSFKEKLKILDYGGFVLSIIGSIFVLVAISGIHVTWSPKDVTFIVIFTIGCIASISFLIYEYFVPQLPMIPLRVFNHIQRLLLFLMCFIMGWAYFVDIYYYPLYLQNVREWTPITSGLVQIPLTCISSIAGVAAGFINSKTGYYARCLYFGGAMWCLGTGLKIMFNTSTNVGVLVASSIIQGTGIGFTFQPTLLTLLTHSDHKDRAVVTGLRNFFRCFGGAVGITASGIVFNSYFKSELRALGFNESTIDNIIADPSVKNHLSENSRLLIVHSYLQCYRRIMMLLTILSGFMFLVSFLTKDNKQPPEEKNSPSDKDEETKESKL